MRQRPRSLPVITPLPTSHEEIVARYIIEKRPEAVKERDYYAGLPTVEEAARQAALALREGKRHSHQSAFRVKQETLDSWAERVLATLDRLASARTFEELHDRLDSLRFKHVGDLIVYDTAYRLGAKLRLEPRLVYLHRGTLEGAVLLGFSKKLKTLELSQLPPAYQALRPYEIEDCLCMYKDDLSRIVGTTPD
jgi:hypothetical protein